MTSAMAAALREIDRSQARLEQALLQNPDFAELRRLDGAQDGTAFDDRQERLVLVQRLEMHPLYQALQSILAAKRHVIGSDATLAAERNTLTPNRGIAATTGTGTGTQVASAAQPLPTQPRPRFTPPPGPPQPLTAIRGISAAIAKQLQAMGIERYEQIASWRAADVQAVKSALGLGREMSRRNWIEQAALLALRSSSSQRPADQAETSPPLGTHMPALEKHRAVATSDRPAASIATTAPAGSAQVLGYGELLRIVAVAASAAVAAVPIEATATPAGAPEPDRPAPVTLPERFEPSERLVWAAGPLARIERRPSDGPLHPPLTRSHLVTPERPTLDVRRVPDEPLHWLRGMDDAVACALVAAGVGSFRAIAGLRAADIARISQQLGIPARRISREGWIEQAAILAAGGETEHCRRVKRGELDCLCPSPPAGTDVPVVSRFRLWPLRGPQPQASTPAAPPRAVPRSAAAQEWVDPGLDGGLEDDDGSSGSPLERISRIDRSSTRMMDEQVSTATVEEATVAFIMRPAPAVVTQAPPAPDAASAAFRPTSPPLSGASSIASSERTQDLPPVAHVARMTPADYSQIADSEEALVEIIRRDAPLVPASGGATAIAAMAAMAAINRTPPLRTGLPKVLGRSADLQPAWIADKQDDPGSVVRRFLKALKRNA